MRGEGGRDYFVLIFKIQYLNLKKETCQTQASFPSHMALRMGPEINSSNQLSQPHHRRLIPQLSQHLPEPFQA